MDASLLTGIALLVILVIVVIGYLRLRANQVDRTNAASQANLSNADRLRELDDLRNKGLISQDEYQARRQAILEKV
jgi:cytochrome c-type biogenesis protein CcmI